MKAAALIVSMLALLVSSACFGLSRDDENLAGHPVCVCAADRTCTIVGIVAIRGGGGAAGQVMRIRDASTNRVVARIKTDADGYYSAENIKLPKDETPASGWRLQEDPIFGSRPMAICSPVSVGIGQPTTLGR